MSMIIYTSQNVFEMNMVDPWTTWVWNVHLHFFFSIVNCTVSLAQPFAQTRIRIQLIGGPLYMWSFRICVVQYYLISKKILV